MKFCKCGCGEAVRNSRSFVNKGHQLRSIYGSGLAPICKCGCGLRVRGKRIFVDRNHMVRWMKEGGASQMNALQSPEAKQRGGHVTGTRLAATGKLAEFSKKGDIEISRDYGTISCGT